MKQIATENVAAGSLDRRQFLTACGVLIALPAVLSSTTALAATASFTLTSSNGLAKVDVYHTRGNGVRCQVFTRETRRSAWVVSPDQQVLVRQHGSSTRFDEQTTNRNGDSRHTARSYTSGMEVDVSVSGLIGAGSGTLL